MYASSQTVQEDFVLPERPRERRRRGDVKSLEYCPLQSLRGGIRSVACQTWYQGDPGELTSHSALRVIHTRRYVPVLRNHEQETGPFPRDTPAYPPGSVMEKNGVKDDEQGEVENDNVAGSNGKERVALNDSQVRLGNNACE